MSDPSATHQGVEHRKILFVTGRLTPTGTCRAIVALARQLNRMGSEVSLVSRSGSVASVYPSGAHKAESDTLPIWLSRAIDHNLRAYLSLNKLVLQIREMNPDLIHVHGAQLAGIGARLARRLRKPYVLDIDDLLDPGQSVPLSRRFIGKVIAASDAIRVDLVNRIRIPREMIEVVPEGVGLGGFGPRAPGLKGYGIPVVGTIGRLLEAKGQEYFIRAAHLLAMRGRTIHFVVAGEGPDRKRLHNLIAELDLFDRVTFARVPVDQLNVLRAIDILVVPALRESLGLPAIEAMAAGIPVIATSAGGIFRLIENGKTGILVPKRDADALARQIEDLIDHPERAAELALRGREAVAEQFNIEGTARRTLEVYDAVLASRTAGAGLAAAHSF